MIYETQIKIKNYIIDIEFDSETEEFNYSIKERKPANAKIESKEKRNEQSDRTSGNEQSDNRKSEPETEFDRL